MEEPEKGRLILETTTHLARTFVAAMWWVAVVGTPFTRISSSSSSDWLTLLGTPASYVQMQIVHAS